MKRFLFLSGIFFLVSFMHACGKKKEKEEETSTVSIKPSLLRIEVPNYTGLVGTTGFPLVNGATKTTNVTIKSLKYPIGSISLSGEPPAGQTASAAGSNALSIYSCSGTSNDECLVELTGTALTDLLANASPQSGVEGTYSQVNISPCFTGGVSEDVRIKLTAEVTIDSVAYYTNSTTGLSTTAPAEEITFSPNGGCNSVRFLTKDIILTEDSFKTKERPVDDTSTAKESAELSEQLDLKLYFDLSNAVIAAGPSTDANAVNETANSDFCRGGTSRVNPYICLNFPEIVGTVDSGTPTLTRMLINGSTIWGFYSNSEGIPFGAYQRSYFNGVYNSSNEPVFLVGSMFERFQINADNSITFQQYDDGQNRHIKVANFTLSNHTGTFTQGSNTVSYTAVKL